MPGLRDITLILNATVSFITNCDHEPCIVVVRMRDTKCSLEQRQWLLSVLRPSSLCLINLIAKVL